MRLYKKYYTYTINRAMFGKVPSGIAPYYWTIIFIGVGIGLIF